MQQRPFVVSHPSILASKTESFASKSAPLLLDDALLAQVSGGVSAGPNGGWVTAGPNGGWVTAGPNGGWVAKVTAGPNGGW
jgi:hypothetical protein